MNFSSSVNLFCSSCEDMLLYNKHKTFYKYLLHRWATWKSCFESVFYGQKAEKCCNDTTAESNWFDFAAVFLQHFFAAKIEFTAVFNGWATAVSYIHAQRGTFLLRVDEKYCSWPLSFYVEKMNYRCSTNDFFMFN